MTEKKLKQIVEKRRKELRKELGLRYKRKGSSTALISKRAIKLLVVETVQEILKEL